MALGQHYLGQTYLGGTGSVSIAATGTVTGTFTAAISSETVSLTMGLTATFAVGYSPEEIAGNSGVVAATFTAQGTPTVQLGTTGAVTGYFSVGVPTLPKVSLPWNQPGNQFVKDILSFGLHANYRVYVQVGVPAAQLGNNGDYCFRPDGVAGARMYVRSSGAWTAIN